MENRFVISESGWKFSYSHYINPMPFEKTFDVPITKNSVRTIFHNVINYGINRLVHLYHIVSILN